jgi:hypothetical protein
VNHHRGLFLLPFDALSLAQGRPIRCAVAASWHAAFDALALAHGKPAGKQENGPGNNADHVARDTTGILEKRCPDQIFVAPVSQ